MVKLLCPRKIFLGILASSIPLFVFVQYETFHVIFQQIQNDIVNHDENGVLNLIGAATEGLEPEAPGESETKNVTNPGVSTSEQMKQTSEDIDEKENDNQKLDQKKSKNKMDDLNMSISMIARTNGQKPTPKNDTGKINENQDKSNAEKVESKAEQVVDVIEECPCPDQKKMIKVLRGLKMPCRITNCTDYKVDISTLEKPSSPFQHYDKVVVTTKVHWPKDLAVLQQMICLFNAAYNRHAGYYDIVVFSTMPWSADEVKELQEVANPANLTVVIDSPPLEDVLASMTEEEVRFLKKRCNCADNETLTWFHHCKEGGFTVNVGYSWQSEFRTYHLWNTQVMAKYKYMIWMDADALATKMWDIDPMKLMVENDLVVMFDNMRGYSQKEVIPKLLQTYNRSICDTKLTDEGYFNATHCYVDNSPRQSKPLIHGFHHITNMDFYRMERNMRFLESMVGDYKFSRIFDDQMAVTLPALMDAGNRSWAYQENGLNFEIFHNGKQDGRKRAKYYVYHRFHWRYNRYKWEAGAKLCNQWITEAG